MRPNLRPTLGIAALLLVATAEAALAQRDRTRIERTVFGSGAKPSQVVEISGIPVRGTYLGVSAIDLTEELREHFGAGADRGVLIASIVEESPAESCGLAVGDVLTAVGDRPVATRFELATAIREHEQGDQVDLEVVRDGRVQQLTATLAERDRPTFDVTPFVFDWSSEDGGPNAVWIDSERIRTMADHLHEQIEVPEIQERLESIRSDRRDLASRVQELEAKLLAMEAELERLTDADGG